MVAALATHGRRMRKCSSRLWHSELSCECSTCLAVGTMVFSYTTSISICTPDPLAGGPGGGAAPALRVWPLALGVTVAGVVALAALGAAVAVVLLQLRRRRRQSEELAGKAADEPAKLGLGGAVVDSAQRAPPELVQGAPGLASRGSAGSPHMSGGQARLLPPELWRLRWLGPLSDEQVEVGPMLARPRLPALASECSFFGWPDLECCWARGLQHLCAYTLSTPWSASRVLSRGTFIGPK